jgi:hypothetical protein
VRVLVNKGCDWAWGLFRYRRWTDPDWYHHQIFLREKSALRQVGRELQRRLGRNHNFVELTLEEDVRSSGGIPV